MKLKTIVILGALAPSSAFAQGNQTTAERIFTEYQERASAFDSSAANLYCDTAIVRNTRTYPDGQQRTLELPAPKYKELIRAAMPIAQARGDTNKYSDVSYQQEGTNVRITATRYSELKRYSSPLSLLVGACNGGNWMVLEELSESRP